MQRIVQGCNPEEQTFRSLLHTLKLPRGVRTMLLQMLPASSRVPELLLESEPPSVLGALPYSALDVLCIEHTRVRAREAWRLLKIV